MAIDSANKRRSVLALDGPMLGIGPVPDGNLAMMADTRHLVGCYRFDDLAALTRTNNQRRSVFGLDGPMFVIFPVPDGSLANKADRRHVAGHYRMAEAYIQTNHGLMVRFREKRAKISYREKRARIGGGA